MSQTNPIAGDFDAPLEEVADYQLPTPEAEDPWMKHAGMFKDEPLFDQVLEEIAIYRRELDADRPELHSDDISTAPKSF